VGNTKNLLIFDLTRPGKAGRGPAWQGKARRGAAGQGMAKQGGYEGIGLHR
jgi:hypothetical protein